jgi:hypothetical protein
MEAALFGHTPANLGQYRPVAKRCATRSWYRCSYLAILTLDLARSMGPLRRTEDFRRLSRKRLRLVIFRFFERSDEHGSGVFRDGIALVTLNGKVGAIDRTGRFIVAPQQYSSPFDSAGGGRL